MKKHNTSQFREKFLLFSFQFFLCPVLYSQQQYLPLNKDFSNWYERKLAYKENPSHTSLKPYLESDIMLDSLEKNHIEEFSKKQFSGWVLKKLKNENLIIVDTGGFKLHIDPLINFEAGKDLTNPDSLLYRNSRGIIVRSDIGKKVSLMTSFLETQAFFPNYITDFVKTYSVAPGQGRVKPFKKSGYDFGIATAYVSFAPSKKLNFLFANDKLFIGDGYRSLLLSDNSFNYPFFKTTAYFFDKKIQYSAIYASMQSLKRIPASTTPEATFERKAATFHYLNFSLFNCLQIGLYESTIWQRRDSSGTLPFNYISLNPVIGINTAIYGFENANNTLLGTTMMLKITNKLSIYSQLMYDTRQKTGIQAGFKWFDVFGLKNLFLQAEYNSVSPYAYAHKAPLQNYAHNNQALAHPLGAAFKEAIGVVRYNWKDLFIQIKGNYAKQIAEAGNWGQNIFLVDDVRPVSSVLPGKSTLIMQEAGIGYLVNPKTNLNLYFGVLNRMKTFSGNTIHTQYVFLSLRTSLHNYYYDF